VEVASAVDYISLSFLCKSLNIHVFILLLLFLYSKKLFQTFGKQESDKEPCLPKVWILEKDGTTFLSYAVLALVIT